MKTHDESMAELLAQDAQLENACRIIEGFLDRFEAPTCIEQQEVVSQALAWLRNYAETLTAQVISQQNQNDTQNYTD